MIKKLKSKSGAAFILAWIFWLLMIFLTGLAFETTKGDSESLNTYQQKQYNYFVNKAALNYYAQLLSGLQYTETVAAEPLPAFLNNIGGTYVAGEFSFVDVDTSTTPHTYTANATKLTDFSNIVNIDGADDFDRGLQEAFGYFQYLRSRVIDGSVVLSNVNIVDTEYLEPHQAFNVVFVIDGVTNTYDNANDFTITTTLTFFGESVVYDNYPSYDENTARVKTVITSGTEFISSDYIICKPVLDDTSGLNVWTWESFS